MTDTPEIVEPTNLKLLRRLVTLLLVVMIVGFLTIIALFVMRLSPSSTTLSDITLPDGVIAQTYTRGSDWYAVTTDKNEILIYNLDNSLRQRIQIQPAP